jgi:hypothetical protein
LRKGSREQNSEQQQSGKYSHKVLLTKLTFTVAYCIWLAHAGAR